MSRGLISRFAVNPNTNGYNLQGFDANCKMRGPRAALTRPNLDLDRFSIAYTGSAIGVCGNRTRM